jgi:hypothetical protein
LRALQNTEVFTAEQIVQRYLVKLGNKEAEGRQQSGNVVLSPEEESLKIYLKDQYLELERNPCELVEKLASFTGIDERNKRHYLLHVVLTESKPNRISAILRTYGVPALSPDNDGEEEEWLSANRVPRMPFPGMSGEGLPHQYATETLTIISSNNARRCDSDGDDSDPDGLDASYAPFLDGLMGDTPFEPGFKIFAVNNRYSQAAGMGGDAIDEDLEFAGENHVSTWHFQRVKNHHADRTKLRYPRLWPSTWPTSTSRRSIGRAAAAQELDSPLRQIATAYLRSRLRIPKVFGPRSSRTRDTQKQELGGLAHQPGTSKSRPQGAHWQRSSSSRLLNSTRLVLNPNPPLFPFFQELGAAFSIAQKKRFAI